MRILIKLGSQSDDARVVNEREIVRIERGAQTAIEQSALGLTLREAKAALAATQQAIVTTQAEQIVSRARHCTHCAAALKVKDSRPIVYRTLFGKIRVPSLRLLVSFRQSCMKCAEVLDIVSCQFNRVRRTADESQKDWRACGRTWREP